MMSTPFHESTNQWLNFGAFLTSSVFRHARQIEEQDHMAQERLCITCFALPLGAGEISLSRSITHRPFTRATETRGLFGDVKDVQWTPALEA